MRRWVSSRKKWVPVVAVAALVAAAVGGWALVHPGQSQATTTTSITTTATVGTVRQTIATTGTLAPAQRADLTFQVAGTVTSVPVAVGQHVAAGATLATVGNTDLRTSVDLANASVTAAEDQVTSAATGTAAQQASAAAQLAAARSTLARAQASLADATLTSPITGTVAAVSIAPGDVVSGSSSSGGSSGSSGSGGSAGSGASGGNGSGGSGASSGSGDSSSSATSSAQITVISTSAWVVNASVGASDLASVHRGLQVVITPDGTNQQVFGTVSSVGIMASSSSSGTAAFPVVVKVTGNPPGLYAGATVSAAIVVKQLDNVLTVPTAAVTSDSNGTYVTVVKNGHDTKTKIVIGTVLGGSTQVISGVSSGDQILVRQLRLTGGTGTTRLRQGTGGGFGGGGFGGGGFGGGGFGGGGGGGGAGQGGAGNGTGNG